MKTFFLSSSPILKLSKKKKGIAVLLSSFLWFCLFFFSLQNSRYVQAVFSLALRCSALALAKGLAREHASADILTPARLLLASGAKTTPWDCAALWFWGLLKSVAKTRQ